jgi:hypothetical protein
MSLLSSLSTLVMTATDALFDAGAALRRVALRGAFAPDAQSLRGARFKPLQSSDVLVREIALNAEDREQARKIITIDPERHLPLDPDAVLFDIAGPLDTNETPRARPERTFALGVVRHETLEKLREEDGRAKNAEGFIYAPLTSANAALCFVDEQGAKRRRQRRFLVALAFACFAIAFVNTLDSASAAFDRAVDEANARHANLERRLRLAQHEERAAQAQGASSSVSNVQPLGDVAAQLQLWARHQPAQSELTSVAVENGVLVMVGKSAAPDQTELELRRGFEDREISFTAGAGAAPVDYEARVGSGITRGQP